MQKRSLGLSTVPFELPLLDPKGVYAYFFRHPDREIRSLHYHAYPEFGYCHDGAGVFILDGEVISYGPGDVVVIPAASPHLAQSAAGTTSDWTFSYFDPGGFLGSLGRHADVLERAVHLTPFTDALLCETMRLFSRAALELNEPQPPMHCDAGPTDRHDVLQGYVHSFLALLGRRPAGQREFAVPLAGDVTPVAPALRYLGAHFHEPLCIDTLAARCNFSTAHFRRVFKRAVGLTPRSYLFKLRIEMAKGMLARQDVSVLEVSLAVGFDSLSSFHRQFKAFTRTSPLQWRRGQRQAH